MSSTITRKRRTGPASTAPAVCYLLREAPSTLLTFSLSPAAPSRAHMLSDFLTIFKPPSSNSVHVPAQKTHPIGVERDCEHRRKSANVEYYYCWVLVLNFQHRTVTPQNSYSDYGPGSLAVRVPQTEAATVLRAQL